MATTPDDKPGFLRLLMPYECHSSIFASLPRSSLKSLRLTCKAVHELVTSPASHLFSRIYLSGWPEDYEVFNSILAAPHLSRCVRELVWDTCVPPQVLVQPPIPRLYEHEEQEQSKHHGEYQERMDEIRHGVLDFRALLCALQPRRLPILNRVVLVELMTLDIDLYFWYESQKGVALDGLQYESPAVRGVLGAGLRSRRRICARIPQQRVVEEAMMEHVAKFAAAVLGQGDGAAAQTEAQAHAQNVAFFELRDMDHRALAMLSVALQANNTRLDSFSLGFDTTDAPDLLSGCCSAMSALSLAWFQGSPTSVTAHFARTLVRPLRRLPVLVREREWPQTAVDRLLDTLNAAVNLEVLKLCAQNSAPASLLPAIIRSGRWSLGSGSRLREVVLGRFGVTSVELEEEIIPWCFENGVRTLRLERCFIKGKSGLGEEDYWHYLVSRDITMEQQDPEDDEGKENENENESRQEPNPTPWPYDSSDSDRTSFYSDDSDYDEKRYMYEYKDAPRAVFLDADFGSDMDDSDSEYATAGLDDSLNEEQHAGMYDEEYLSDTADLPLEAVDRARPLDARMASRAVGVNRLDVELVFEEERWNRSRGREGGGKRLLTLRIDGYMYSCV